MGKTLGQILMDEARQTGLQEWMKKVQVAVRQTDVKNPVTWTALERLSRDEDNMPRLVKLLKEHCPCPSLKTQEERQRFFGIFIGYNESIYQKERP